ncbi:hypothetical protein [Deinococcus hopiensis]|uniref:Uncharacterized protein n=1 Tax=Deinococcus hopiensis KR-140 TaxID=695939 RepID=A0A1W1VCC8_9DEIO|nr:hypothetical protein [Deinococcus hopiensis]SMB90624.1 hypothetical protein SAMN00790413_00836 [Deinococcus hopiensis KR-140]
MPVRLLSQLGQGSVCEGGFTETYRGELAFVRASEATGAGGRMKKVVADTGPGATREPRAGRRSRGGLQP